MSTTSIRFTFLSLLCLLPLSLTRGEGVETPLKIRTSLYQTYKGGFLSSGLSGEWRLKASILNLTDKPIYLERIQVADKTTSQEDVVGYSVNSILTPGIVTNLSCTVLPPLDGGARTTTNNNVYGCLLQRDKYEVSPVLSSSPSSEHTVPLGELKEEAIHSFITCRPRYYQTYNGGLFSSGASGQWRIFLPIVNTSHTPISISRLLVIDRTDTPPDETSYSLNLHLKPGIATNVYIDAMPPISATSANVYSTKGYGCLLKESLYDIKFQNAIWELPPQQSLSNASLSTNDLPRVALDSTASTSTVKSDQRPPLHQREMIRSDWNWEYHTEGAEENLHVVIDGISGNLNRIEHITIPAKLQGIVVRKVKRLPTLPGLTSLRFSSANATFDSYAFSNHLKLQKIIFDDRTTTSFNQYAFAGCKSLSEILFPNEGSVSFSHSSFSRCNGFTSLVIPRHVNFGGYAFEHCTSLETVTSVEGSTAEFGDSAFRGCTKLTSVKFPDASDISFQDYAFSYCSGLKDLVLPRQITFDSFAFAHCTSLETVTSVEESTAEFGGYAFSDCTKLASVKFPETCTVTLSYRAFHNCPALKKDKPQKSSTASRHPQTSPNLPTPSIHPDLTEDLSTTISNAATAVSKAVDAVTPAMEEQAKGQTTVTEPIPTKLSGLPVNPPIRVLGITHRDTKAVLLDLQNMSFTNTLHVKIYHRPIRGRGYSSQADLSPWEDHPLAELGLKPGDYGAIAVEGFAKFLMYKLQQDGMFRYWYADTPEDRNVPNGQAPDIIPLNEGTRSYTPPQDLLPKEKAENIFPYAFSLLSQNGGDTDKDSPAAVAISWIDGTFLSTNECPRTRLTDTDRPYLMQSASFRTRMNGLADCALAAYPEETIPAGFQIPSEHLMVQIVRAAGLDSIWTCTNGYFILRDWLRGRILVNALTQELVVAFSGMDMEGSSSKLSTVADIYALFALGLLPNEEPFRGLYDFVQGCQQAFTGPICFVGHSLGGGIVSDLANRDKGTRTNLSYVTFNGIGVPRHRLSRDAEIYAFQRTWNIYCLGDFASSFPSTHLGCSYWLDYDCPDSEEEFGLQSTKMEYRHKMRNLLDHMQAQPGGWAPVNRNPSNRP